jgi:transcriptional regulator with XRE-family HTH domain
MDGLVNARTLRRIGSVTKALRTRREMTQAETADAAGVSRQWLIALEAGPADGVELGRLLRVLDVLDASIWIRDDKEGTC